MKITIATLVVFTVEIALTCYGKPDYFNSFYFWLDIVATVSIITDIEPVWSAITGRESADVASEETN